MLLKWGLPLFLLIASHSIEALIEQTIDEKEPIQAAFSLDSHNRISVVDGAVEKIYGDNALFSVQIDATTGHAFVNLLQEIETPTALTVVTSFGLVQDFSIVSKGGPATQVLLKDPQEEEFELLMQRELTLEKAVCTINQILDGKIPFGFGEREILAEEEVELPEPLFVENVRALEGPFETICVIRIENRGPHPIILGPDALRQRGGWVFLDSKELKAGGSSTCLMGFFKGDKHVS